MESIFSKFMLGSPEPLDRNSQFGSNIYNLFTSLEKLFDHLGILSQGDVQDLPEKFRFIHAYPEQVYNNTSNTVTYRLAHRAHAVAQSSALPNRNPTKYGASIVEEQVNIVSGNIDELYKVEFENIVKFTIFSTKTRNLNNIARVLEAIFIKYASYMKNVVDHTVYLGTSDIGFLENYDDQEPIYTREMTLRVYTTEVFTQELEQVKSIDLHIK